MLLCTGDLCWGPLVLDLPYATASMFACISRNVVHIFYTSFCFFHYCVCSVEQQYLINIVLIRVFVR